jgi:YHS domain-containing protein
MADHRTVAADEDAVCGMTVNVEEARTKGLVRTHEGREYAFCGKGCFLEFGDEPETFLAVGFTPSM